MGRHDPPLVTHRYPDVLDDWRPPGGPQSSNGVDQVRVIACASSGVSGPGSAKLTTATIMRSR